MGGSLIVPDTIDTSFLSTFRDCILQEVQNGLSFFIITGGGRTARNYQQAAESVRGDLSRSDVDWLGIHSPNHLFLIYLASRTQQPSFPAESADVVERTQRYDHGF